jgi:hypothetical protein
VFWHGIRIPCKKERNKWWKCSRTTYGVYHDESDALAVSLMFVHVTLPKSQKLSVEINSQPYLRLLVLSGIGIRAEILTRSKVAPVAVLWEMSLSVIVPSGSHLIRRHKTGSKEAHSRNV